MALNQLDHWNDFEYGTVRELIAKLVGLQSFRINNFLKECEYYLKEERMILYDRQYLIKISTEEMAKGYT